MDIKRRIEDCAGFTPAEQQLAGTVLALGGRLHGLTIKELARAAHVSIPRDVYKRQHEGCLRQKGN